MHRIIRQVPEDGEDPVNHACDGCMWFSERQIGTGEEGEPLMEYRCESRVMTEAEAVFGCGLFRRKRDAR